MSKTVILGMETRKMAYDPELVPEAYIDSGDTVIFESEDANCSLIRTEEDIAEMFQDLRLKAAGSDPVCGPVYVNGAKEGDYLRVWIEKVEPGPWRLSGYTSIQGGLGWLEHTRFTLHEKLPSTTRVLTFDEDGYANMTLEGGKEKLRVPLRPFTGCIGVAPRWDRVRSDSLNEEYCGNVDIPFFRAGSAVTLRCNVDGGLLSIGDVHGTQGDGEITGCAIECQGCTTVRVELIKKEDMPYYGCPQVDTEEILGSVGIWSKNQTYAISRAYADLVRRIHAEYGIGEADAYMLLGLAGKVQIGNSSSAMCYVERSVLTKYEA